MRCPAGSQNNLLALPRTLFGDTPRYTASPSTSKDRLSTHQIYECLNLPSHLRGPPPRSHQQKPPILQKLRRPALNRVPHELQHPPETKEPQSQPQQPMPHDSRRSHRQRRHDDRYPMYASAGSADVDGSANTPQSSSPSYVHQAWPKSYSRPLPRDKRLRMSKN
jgi:hypothetical protein